MNYLLKKKLMESAHWKGSQSSRQGSWKHVPIPWEISQGLWEVTESLLKFLTSQNLRNSKED